MADKKGSPEVPEVDLGSYSIDPKVLSLISPSFAGKHKLIPLFRIGDVLTVAMADPKDIVAQDEARKLTKMDISVVKSDEAAIKEAISEYYGISATIIEDIVKKYKPPAEELKDKLSAAAAAPIVKLVDAIISQAIKERASDIHIEPETEDVRVRYRVDGILHEEQILPSHILASVVSRVKILAGMDIAESRIPQDGRFELDQAGKKIDLRVSSFPSVYGEKVVMRILDKSAALFRLTDLGFSKEKLEKFTKIVHKPHGIILVTGPTGSGKTSTLYAALSEINSKELNIITVEDPVEYELPGITQSQINVKAGLTFASALRSILRQDPDVILIGEIRDIETARIAIQSAMTGHLVFSTLHTNDAAGALGRLLDMGVEPFLTSSSVEGILAQRLVRTICQGCKREVSVPEDLKAKFPDLKSVFSGKGCKTCKGIGYKGRTGIFELLVIDDATRKMINNKASADEIKEHAVSCGMKTMYEDGLEKIKAGITTMDEVLRVTELE